MSVRLLSNYLLGLCLSLPALSWAGEPEHGVDWDFINTYCMDCHNYEDFAGGLSFDTLVPENVVGEAEIWEEAVRKLRGRMMPPSGHEQPSQESVDEFVAELTGHLDEAAEHDYDPGTVVLHRLNRTEYENAIADILGLEIDATELLPRDDESDGFDNVANVLKISPTFLDQYISAARQLSIQAMGNPNATQDSKFYPGTADSIQNIHVDGLPLGTRGGMLVEHSFPVDGEYEFNLVDVVGGGYVWGVHDENRLIITIDGKKVFEQSVGGHEDLESIDVEQAAGFTEINNRFRGIRAKVSAGPHKVGVTFVGKSSAESNEMLHSHVPIAGMSVSVSAIDKGPRIVNFEIKGPLSREGVSATPSRDKILSCEPTSSTEEQTCAQEILSNIAKQAFRRPIESKDIAGAMSFYESGASQGGFEVGLQKGIMAILASPNFLYRVHTPPEGTEDGSSFMIPDNQLASRLSFFLWSSLPDEELLAVAEQGNLHEPVVLEQQVKRMLADPRAHSLVTNFAFQWLNIQGLDQVDSDTDLFPQYTEDLIVSFKQELSFFIGSIFEEDASISELLSADYTYLNERLALHYGINNVRGGRFRRVELEDSFRRGLLGKGAVLMTTSYADRTTPVIRGAYLMEKILGTPPAAPPPGVEAFPENAEGEQVLTVRERLAMHRENPSCSGCHGVMDPLGLALENFNAVGQWRDIDRDAGIAIDATGQLVDGTPLSGVDDLREALLDREDMFVQTFTEKLMTFALGRGVEYSDMPAVRKIVRNAKASDYQFSEIVLGIVNSDAFKMDSLANHEEVAGL